MKRLLSALAAVAVGGVLAAAGPAAASPDDQAAADAAIAAFNDRMTEAGGESSGPPDTSPVDEEEYAAENPGSECFGEFATGLDPGGHLEGQTARADADHFSFTAEDEEATGTDEVNAAVITVDDEHRETIRDFVGLLGSGDMETCLEDAFTTAIAAEAEAAAAGSGSTIAAEQLGSVDVTADADIGVGDASSHLRLTVSYLIEETPYVYNLDVYVAVADRTLVTITVDTGEEQVSGFDPMGELEDLIDSLS